LRQSSDGSEFLSNRLCRQRPPLMNPACGGVEVDDPCVWQRWSGGGGRLRAAAAAVKVEDAACGRVGVDVRRRVGEGRLRPAASVEVSCVQQRR
jgi:hypothetical protein